MIKLTNLSLTKRLLLLYLIGPLLLFILFGGTSYLFVRQLMEGSMQVSMQSDLRQSLENIEKARKDLQAVTEQLAIGSSGNLLSAIEEETQAYEISRMIQEIKNQIGIISFTNSDLRLFGYYDTESETFLYTNSPYESESLALPHLLAQENKFHYYGPYISRQRFNEDLVLAVTREVPGLLSQSIVVYAEIRLPLKTDTLFLEDADILVRDSQGVPVYSTFDDTAQYESVLAQVDTADQGAGRLAHWAKATSPAGYELVLSISKAEYNRQLRAFLVQSVLILLVFFGLFVLIGLMVYKTAVQPLNRFKREIQLLRTGDITSTEITQKINIHEYDTLLEEFMLMKDSIRKLLHQTKVDERERAQMRLDMLVYQINPHFLMNTLNTIHWLALSRGAEDIDRVALSMNRLLHYNLKSEDRLSPLREELAAVQQYVNLQQTRFDFVYTLCAPDEALLDTPVPRFILQPLVENAIYHGLSEMGEIEVSVFREAGTLNLRVRDNGRGMTEAERLHLLDDARGFSGQGEMGIGLSYVQHVLREQFGNGAEMVIESKPGAGTAITLRIPFLEENGGHPDDPRSDR